MPKISKFIKLAAFYQAPRTTAAAHQHPLRSHPDVMEFVNEPIVHAKEAKMEMLRPIESLPIDMPEAMFARVKFLGDEYWITSDPGEDAVLVGGEYVVVEKDQLVIGTMKSGKATGGSDRKFCESRSK